MAERSLNDTEWSAVAWKPSFDAGSPSLPSPSPVPERHGANPSETGMDARVTTQTTTQNRDATFRGMFPLNRARVGSSIRLRASRAGAPGAYAKQGRVATEQLSMDAAQARHHRDECLESGSQVAVRNLEARANIELRGNGHAQPISEWDASTQPKL